jgi:hypothetical protein
MARESQGLQIALIVFVMLTVVLGVTTFLYHSRYTEALKSAKDEQDRAAADRSKLANSQTECSELKRMVGMSEKSIGDIREKFDGDMKRYGANFPEDARFYSPMLNHLWDAVEDRNKEAKALKDKLQDLDSRFALREAAKDKQIDQFKEAVAKSSDDMTKLSTDYDEQRAKTLGDEKGFLEKLSLTRKEASAQIEQVGAKVKEAEAVARDEAKTIHEQGTIIHRFNQPTMDIPAGEVTLVVRARKVVWINLGRADALNRQTSFNVYSSRAADLAGDRSASLMGESAKLNTADSADMGRVLKKATIEVTRILGDHLAEARIVDETADPIVPGDKIHTPLWAPGEQVRYALAGFMDLDGDGRNELGTVAQLITSNGGVVDCFLDPQGNRLGAMSPRTRYLVLGNEPTSKSPPELLKQYTAMVGEADRLNIQKITLAELKRKMDYKKTVLVERFVPGPPAADVGRPASTTATPAAKPEAAAKPRRGAAKPKAAEPAADQ